MIELTYVLQCAGYLLGVGGLIAFVDWLAR